MDLLVKQAVAGNMGRIVWGVTLVLLLQAGPAGGAELSIIETVKLDFGAVVDSDGTVVLGLADAIISDPSGIHVGTPVATAQFTITGDPFAAFSLSVVGYSAAGLGVSDFDTSEGTPPLLSVALDGAGELDLRLGATLTVESSIAAPGINQPLIYVITINYN
jgi:hypothetical protein